jgi:transketolase
MERLGVPGVFAPTGSANFLLDEFGMSPNGIVDRGYKLIKRKV